MEEFACGMVCFFPQKIIFTKFNLSHQDSSFKLKEAFVKAGSLKIYNLKYFYPITFANGSIPLHPPGRFLKKLAGTAAAVMWRFGL
jgi:hypothetical protein